MTLLLQLFTIIDLILLQNPIQVRVIPLRECLYNVGTDIRGCVVKMHKAWNIFLCCACGSSR